jgi:hypothetical protein
VVALVGAIAGLVAPLAQLGLDKLKWSTDAAKVQLDQRKASAELYRAALANANADQRHKIVMFLIQAKLVDPNDAVAQMPASQIPHWPAQ